MPLSVSSGRRHNVLDLSVRPSVRSSVTNLMYTIFWKEMNRFWYKLPKVVYEGHERIILGSEGQRSGGNAVVMRKSWFKAPASSSGRRGEKPYLRFPPPAGSPDQLPPRGTPPGQLQWDILSVGWTLVRAGRTLMNLQTVYTDCR